jgi:hypothetical protein
MKAKIAKNDERIREIFDHYHQNDVPHMFS